MVHESDQQQEDSLTLIEDPKSSEGCCVEKDFTEAWQQFQRGWKLCGASFKKHSKYALSLARRGAPTF